MSQVLPKRPYLLRAMHQWITDCGNTPHVIVDAGREGAEVPRAYVKDGKIVLNLSEGATQRLLGLPFECVDGGVGLGQHLAALGVPGAVGGDLRAETGEAWCSRAGSRPSDPPDAGR
jgi:stringent starvation protein B